MKVSVRSWQPGGCISLMLALGLATPLCAQSLRDPTLPPASVAPAVAGVAAQTVSVQTGAMAVLVRNGTPYMVLGTRLYATGQKVGAARIERISETEVWLREAGVLRKVAVFSGIQRQPKQASAAVENRTGTARKSVSKQP